MSQKLQLDLELLLPELPDQRDRCAERLKANLEDRLDIDGIHWLEADEEHPPRLCIHYDPDRFSLAEIRQVARQAGAELTDRYGHLLFEMESTHPRRARSIEARLGQLDGVLEAAASAEGLLRIEFERAQTDDAKLVAAIRKLGLTVRRTQQPSHARSETPPFHDEEPAEHTHEHSDQKHVHEHDHGGLFGERTELAFAMLSGLFLGVGWLLEVATSINTWVSLGCYWAAFFCGGFFTVREAIENIRAGRFEIDFLMLVAAAGAAALGKWAEGALLLFLFSLGHALEHYAMGRARRAIESLADLAPETARVRRDGQVQEIPVAELQPGDVVIVKPNERLPADGFVIKGESSVNQAPITGESVPVDKRAVADSEQAAQDPERLEAKHRVFAATINQSGALEVQVTKRSAETTLALVVQLVSEAETQKSPTQRFTDRFERYFVPLVLTVVVLLLFAPLVLDETFATSFYRAMAVLVAASPCALAISTPSAVLSGVARAARGGVLVKGGGPLESLGRLDAIAFDKTGTLTEGSPRLTDVVPAEGVAEADLLRIAIAVEDLSDHPLAAAVVRGGRDCLENAAIPTAHNLQSMTGRGVKAEVDDQPVYIGKDDLFAEIDGPPLPEPMRAIVERLEADGRTTMIVRMGEQYLGVLGLMDTPRESAPGMIQRLRALGIRRMIMISGDNQQVADAVAQKVGLDEAWGDLMPEDKVESIRTLRSQRGVAMVGDGVNDAPAMATASVGIAMGAAGSDVALETADVALMADDLDRLPFAIGLSRQTSRIIRQNLWFSLGMVAFLVPATIFGLQIGAAVAFHEGSTLLVVFNALRLLAYQDLTSDGSE